MSHVFLQPGHSPQRPDWLAEDAVSCEPVSARNSLLTGKFTGNFAGIGLAACDFRVSLQPIQWFPVEFPIQRNREFSDAYQGKSFEEQRICNPDIHHLTFDLLVSAFPLVGAPTKSPIKKICSWALAIRDCRAASCLRIRDGEFRAAAIPAPRGRRNHQALLEDMETVS